MNGRHAISSRRHQAGVFLMVLGLLTALFGVMAEAVPIAPGNGTGFEIEGDQVDGPDAAVDWQSVAGSSNLTVLTDDTLDSGLGLGSKENDPSLWECNTGGANPGKANILKAAIHSRITPAAAYLDLAYVRESGNGDTHINFEFNQNAVTLDCAAGALIGRSTGDLLLLFNFPGNGSASVEVYRWSTTPGDGEWILDPDLPIGLATGADNAAAITDANEFIFDVASIGEREFGEVSLNLGAILDEQPGSGTCTQFGAASIRSRSSGESLTSSLQDIVGPSPINLSTCGQVTIHKTDDAGTPLAGATFGLFSNLVDAQSKANAVQTCVSAADGICTFADVAPGHYFIAEISAPAGHNVDPDIVEVDVAFRQTVDVAAPFVDPRQVGFVQITKAIAGLPNAPLSTLDGATFELHQNGQVASLWPTPPSDDPATCTITGGSGFCVIGPVPVGSYDVVETVAPNGTDIGPAIPPVNVTEGTAPQAVQVTYTNPPKPIQIDLDKSGPEVADIGDTFTYTFAVTNTGTLPLGNITLLELNPDRCNAGPISGPVKTGGNQDAFLDPGGEVWSYTCLHLVTPADGTLLHNVARASGTDQFGRTVTSDDDHDVVIRYPDLNVVKDGNGTVNAGGTATFTITVTNQGPAKALNATLTDTLPAGTWTLGGANAAQCSIGAGNALSCNFGTLDAGASRSFTVSRTVTIADCGNIDNTAVVSTVYNPGGIDIDHDDADNSDAGTVVVSCPDVGVTKVATADPISAGDTAEFTITIENFGNGQATGVTLSDPLPAGISWSIFSDSGPGAACSIGGGALTCPSFNLDGGQTRVLVIRGVTDAADCGLLTNTATIATQNGDTNPTNNSSTDTIEVRCPDLEIEKTAADGSISAGEAASFTITVTNLPGANVGTAYGVTLTDELPGGLIWQLAPGAPAHCSLAGADLECGPVDLAPGASFSVTVTGLTSFEACAFYDNEAFVEATNAPQESDDASIACQAPNLSIIKTADDSVVDAGDPVGFTITVANDDEAGDPNDGGTAFSVDLADTLPAGLAWVLDNGGSADHCSLNGLLLECGPVDLAPGESFHVHVTATTSAQACATYPNVASAEASNHPAVDDEATITCRLPNVSVDKTPDGTIVEAGDAIEFGITVANDDAEGTGGAKDVTLNDPLPGGTPPVSWSLGNVTGDVDPDCEVTGAAGSQTLACSAVDLAPGQSYTVTVTATTTTTACGEYDNTATVAVANGAGDSDDGLINCLKPGLGVVKTADDEVVAAGDDIGFEIVVSNTDGESVATADGVTLDDPLPAGVTWSIDSVTGDVEPDCQIDAGVLTCDAVDLAPGDSYTVHVLAETTEDACAVYDNTATASATNAPDASDGALITCLDIDIVKDGPDLAHVGDTVTYTFVVTNDGGADLVNVVLDDPDCDATPTLVDDGDGDTTLAVGEVWTYECDRVIEAGDPDPVPNTGTVTGEDEDENETSDSDDHEVDLIHPAIQIVKSVNDATPDVGQTVTFTYTVTNTGDTALFNIAVVDDRLGAIGTIAQLAAGASTSLTKTMVVAANSPLVNVGTATGSDVLGKTVTDDDPETISITQVLPQVQQQQQPQPPPQPLPRTGTDARQLLILAGILLIMGGALLGGTTRRRSLIGR